MSLNIKKVSPLGLLVALGIIFGDIGTSPLYVFNAIIGSKTVSEQLIIGSLSCIIWTLTLQTTIKYVILTLKADNRGEGGIFSLYALVRRRKRWLVIPAMIGGAALLADGMITPPISITSAIEGLRQIPRFSDISQQTIVLMVLGIITVIFFLQQVGTASIGKLFGPIMLTWFLMIATMGLLHFLDDWNIFKALNPYYAIDLLVNYPQGFWILGAVFLCTTGAEALYSDLGHCGRGNIRVSWIFVKSCLIINYLGQGAWLLANYEGKGFNVSQMNAFYGIMPEGFRIIGIVIATAAAIIASQALITGSFTLISEAMRLNLWPKVKIRYPSEERGQVYIRAINFLLFTGCVSVVLYFQRSSRMEGAYGLAITLCMIATSILFANFLVLRRTNPILVYLTSADNPKEIEHKIIYSILNKKPKRADIYWFVHVDTMDDPYTCEYKVEHIIPNDIIRVDFKLGFRIQPRIHILFRQVVEALVLNREINISSKYETADSKAKATGDFQFIVMEKYLSHDNDLPFFERIVMNFYFWLKAISLSEEKGFGLDQSNVTVEKFPLVIGEVERLPLRRILDQ